MSKPNAQALINTYLALATINDNVNYTIACKQVLKVQYHCF